MCVQNKAKAFELCVWKMELWAIIYKKMGVNFVQNELKTLGTCVNEHEYKASMEIHGNGECVYGTNKKI